MPGGLIEAGRAALLLVDMQEKLLPAMDAAGPVVENCAILLKAADRLGVPLIVSEQYPKGLGPTVPPLDALIPAEAKSSKTHFSCAADPGLSARFDALDRRQVVIAGVEAHVCVLQTALGLAGRGFEVFVAADATTARRPENKALALERLRAAGVQPVATEMVLFEWMGQAGTPVFKDLSGLIK
ncbi:MAG: hydrolase [Rhodospirillaceae bacterium]|nr:hydrolase [Rhodospirillaceae bacterium]